MKKSVSEYRTYVRTRIGPVETLSMLDTGNSFHVSINADMKQALRIKKSDLEPFQGRTSIGTAKKSARMSVEGITKRNYEIYLDPDLPPIITKLVVLPELGMPVNISGRALEENGVTILVGKSIIFKGKRIPLVSRKTSAPDINRHAAHVMPVYTSCDVVVEPHEEVYVSAIALDSWGNNKSVNAVLTPAPGLEGHCKLHPWRSAIVTMNRDSNEEEGKYRTKVGFVNITSSPVKLQKGTYFGTAEMVSSMTDPDADQFRLCYLSNTANKRRNDSQRDLSPEGVSRIGESLVIQNSKRDGKVGDYMAVSQKCSKEGGATESAIKGKANYEIPPSPDKQSDPMAGDSVELPDWMKGPTSTNTYTRRYDFLVDLFKVKSNPNLADLPKRKQFITLLLLHWELFAWDGQYGKTNLIQHYIRTPKDCKPVNERYRPPNPVLRKSLQAQLEKWKSHGVIEQSDSAWNSNLLAVVKSSDVNSVRWVVDFRKLNSVTTIDRFPIGDIQDNLSRLGKSKLFSCLDNSGAFHCIPIAPEDRHKTSFASPFNCWHFCRLPFGLSGGPSSYARLVVQVLRNIPPEKAVAYVDDILIHAATFEQHLSNLDNVFKAYTKAGLKLNPKKCTFIASKIDYLGHTVSEAGIEPQQAYLEIVKKWPLPRTRQEISVFLGKTGYYRKFVANYAKIAKPLTDKLKIASPDKTKQKQRTTGRTSDDGKIVMSTNRNQLTQSGGKEIVMSDSKSKLAQKIQLSKAERRRKMEQPIELDEKCKIAFQTLKNKLLSAPILGHPRFDDLKNECFYLDTDWCMETNSVSGILSQRHRLANGKFEEKVIGYASKKLQKSQANYSSPKGEICAALLMMDHYRYFLQIGHFYLRTDNAAARALQGNMDPVGFLSRWKARLASYSFTAVHRAGKKHGNADSLSRIRHTTNNPDENEDVFDEKTDRQYLFSLGESNSQPNDSRMDDCVFDDEIDFIEDDFLDNDELEEELYRELCDTSIEAVDESGNLDSTRDEIWTTSFIIELQEEDSDIRQLREWVRTGTKPQTQDRAVASSDLKTYINLFESLYLDSDDILRYEYRFMPYDGLGERKRALIVLPESSLKDAIRIVHERQSHLGVDRTIEVAMRYVYGLHLRRAAEYVCQTCLVCQAKGGKPKPQDYHLSSSRNGFPFQTINIDFCGPLARSKNNNIYLLTVECLLTKWVEAFATKRATAIEVAEKLTTEIFPRYGYPEFLKSDRGVHFKNNLIRELAEITGIQLTYSPAYRPCSNPIERAHRTIKGMITARVLQLSGGDQSTWEMHLPGALLSYRTSYHGTIGTSPFEALFGNPPSIECGLIFGPPPDRVDYPDRQSYAQAHRHRMSQAFKWINDNISTTITRRRRYFYNNPKRLFNLNDQVWLLTPTVRPGQRKSFKSPYTGPWTVSARINEVVYEIQPHPSWTRKSPEVVTVDRLKKFRAPDDEDDDEFNYPPGTNQDLSLPGNEFLEQFQTTGGRSTEIESDDDADEGGGSDYSRSVSPHQSPAPSPAPSPPPSPPPLSPPDLPPDEPHFQFPPDQQPEADAELERPPQVEEPPPQLQQPQQNDAEQRPLGARPREPPAARLRNSPSQWRSRVKGEWADVAPTRRLPSRQAANRTFAGARTYRPERRRPHSPSDDDEIDEFSDTLASPDEDEMSGHASNLDSSLQWDYSDLERTLTSQRQTEEKQQVPGDLSDQSIVLQNRQSIAQAGDSRRSSARTAKKPALASIPEKPLRPTRRPISSNATKERLAGRKPARRLAKSTVAQPVDNDSRNLVTSVNDDTAKQQPDKADKSDDRRDLIPIEILNDDTSFNATDAQLNFERNNLRRILENKELQLSRPNPVVSAIDALVGVDTTCTKTRSTSLNRGSLRSSQARAQKRARSADQSKR